MLGMGLAELWKFPRSCQLVAGHHHDPAALADSHRTLVMIVHVADVLCCQAGKGFTLTAGASQVDPKAMAELNLTPASLEVIRNSIDGWLNAASNLF
jgi:hypothetical protein